MKRTIQVILFGLWALAASVSCSGNRPAAAPSAVGVWADRDCELLRTERFALLFESNGDTTTSLLQRMDATDTVLSTGPEKPGSTPTRGPYSPTDGCASW